VRGTCTDSLLVVHPSLHAGLAKQMRARGLGAHPAAGDGFWRLRHVTPPGPAGAGAAPRRAAPVQTAHVLFVSAWVALQPRLESPPVGDVHAACHALQLQPPYYEQRVSECPAKLGGHTWLGASPTCRLCHTCMAACFSVPCDGRRVVPHSLFAMVLQLFKCPLHPCEMQCMWVTPPRAHRSATPGQEAREL